MSCIWVNIWVIKYKIYVQTTKTRLNRQANCPSMGKIEELRLKREKKVVGDFF
jgi:hypothetical protein